MNTTKNTIVEEIQKIYLDKSLAPIALSDDTNLLADTEMDSLDLATLIVNLELIFEFDPFREGFKTFNTLDELSALYEQKNKV